MTKLEEDLTWIGVNEHIGSGKLPKRVNGITVSKFTWPWECPFGGGKLFTFCCNIGCMHNCGYCWAHALLLRMKTLEKLGTPWNEPHFRAELVEMFEREMATGRYAGQHVLFSNMGDMLGGPSAREALPDLLALALEHGAIPVVITKGILTFDPEAFFREHSRLAEAIQNSEHGIWWGVSVTTMDEEVAAEIEPGAPPPAVRLQGQADLVLWAAEHAPSERGGIPGKIRGFVSIGGWHQKGSPRKIIEAAKGSAQLVILELLHRQDLQFPWHDYLVEERTWFPELRELLTWVGGERLGLTDELEDASAFPKLVLKDELREAASRDAGMRSNYEGMHGKGVFVQNLPRGQQTLKF